MCFVVPTLVPWGVWGESLWNSYFLASILRYTVSLNVTWLVNSAAHMYGNRPYDRHISPRQNPLVTLGAIGESGAGAHIFLAARCFARGREERPWERSGLEGTRPWASEAELLASPFLAPMGSFLTCERECLLPGGRRGLRH